MKIVIAGGTGQVGALAATHWLALGHEVVVLSRGGASAARVVRWDGKTLEDAWVRELDGADVVLNLAGRSVSCRYTEENLAEMLSSRVDSTRVVGAAIAGALSPPKLWLQMSANAARQGWTTKRPTPRWKNVKKKAISDERCYQSNR